MMPSSNAPDESLQSTTPASKAQRQVAYLGQRYQQLLDYTTPLLTGRWITTTLLLLAYIARVFIAQAWYIVTVLYDLFDLFLVCSWNLSAEYLSRLYHA
jgi:hypothetical protein